MSDPFESREHQLLLEATAEVARLRAESVELRRQVTDLTADRDDHRDARKLLATDLSALGNGEPVRTGLAFIVEQRMKATSATGLDAAERHVIDSALDFRAVQGNTSRLYGVEDTLCDAVDALLALRAEAAGKIR